MFPEEIWNKKIPPSYYVETIIEKRQQKTKQVNRILIFTAIAGSYELYENDFELGIGVIGPLSMLGLLYTNFYSSKESKILKTKFKEINSIVDVNEKEKTAYEFLVFLAEKSKKNRTKIDDAKNKQDKYNQSNKNRHDKVKDAIKRILLKSLIDDSIKKEEKEYVMTYYERVLNNYLKQKK